MCMYVPLFHANVAQGPTIGTVHRQGRPVERVSLHLCRTRDTRDIQRTTGLRATNHRRALLEVAHHMLGRRLDDLGTVRSRIVRQPSPVVDTSIRHCNVESPALRADHTDGTFVPCSFVEMIKLNGQTTSTNADNERAREQEALNTNNMVKKGRLYEQRGPNAPRSLRYTITLSSDMERCCKWDGEWLIRLLSSSVLIQHVGQKHCKARRRPRPRRGTVDEWGKVAGEWREKESR